VVTDPHDGKSIGIRPPLVWADIVLISHDHFDHNCSRIVKGDFVTLRGAVNTKVRGVPVSSIQAFHDEVGGEKRGSVYLFKFEMDGISFCHLGDLGHTVTPEQADFLSGVDIMFIPVGGVITIDGEEARRIVDLIKPKVAVPMHYRMGGLSLSIHTIDQFLMGVPENLLLRVGNEVDILAEDLPQTTEFWVFSP
jgi:L-ascorbate metabolism protein UlaG (beta-lactamase superfamily)